MAFPQTPLPARVDLYVGGTYGWVDLTAAGDVRLESATSGGGIAITRKRVVGQQSDPGKCSLTLNQKHGKYSARNPRSPYYGLIGRNTPLRVAIAGTGDTFSRTVSSGWGTSSDGVAWSTLGGSAADFSVASGVGRHSHSTVNALRGAVLGVDLVDVEQLVDVTTPVLLTGAALVTGCLARYIDGNNFYWLRCEMNAGGTSIQLKITRKVAGVETQLANMDPLPGVTYGAGVPMRVRATVAGAQLALKVWRASDPEPSDWQVTAVDTALTAAGKVGLQTWLVGGNTNTLPVVVSHASYATADPRCMVEVSSWPPRWDLSGSDVWVPIEASGVLRRLGQGQKRLRSALYRATLAAAPTAYWPLEDGPDAVAAASAVDGVEPMRAFNYSRFTIPDSGGRPEGVAGLPKFGAGQGIPGSAPVVDMSQGGVLQASLPPATGDGWQIEWTMIVPRDAPDNEIQIEWRVDNGNSHWRQWQVQTSSTGSGISSFFSDPGTGISYGSASDASLNPCDGLAHHWRVLAVNSGSQVYAELQVDGVLVDQYVGQNGNTMVGRAGRVTQVIVNPLEQVNGTKSMAVIGHVAVWQTDPIALTTTTVEASRAWVGEAAAARIARLAAEEGLPVVVVDPAGESEPMGPQGIATALDLIRDCATVDGGILYESRIDLGLIYRTRVSLYNQTPVQLDYSAGHIHAPFEPVDDDDAVRNDITVKSTSTGATARAVQETGPLSILPPPAGVGPYEEEVPLNAVDGQLADQAEWRRRLGTVDEARYPRLRVNLAAPDWVANPALTRQATAVDLGGVVSVANLPDWLPPGPVKEMVQGYVETLDAYQRDLVWTAVPGSPWDVAVVDGTQRVAADGSTLTAGITSVATSMQITSTAATGPWTTDPTDFPLDINLGGVKVTLSAISGASSPQTATITARAVALAHAAGTPVDVWDPATVAL
jgi:hypothetical protein